MDDGDDVFNKLPDHLLIYILSRLTLKEAMVTTSVLSRRWEKLWTFYHGNLDFEVAEGVERSGCSEYSILELVEGGGVLDSFTDRQKGCSNYFKMVNKVLDTLQGGGVFDSFTIRFDSCPNNLSSVDRCVQFALEKRGIKRLDFKCYLFSTGCLPYGMMSYDFPPLQCFYAQNRNIQALTSISFDHVNVSGEIIEHFLSNCPLLQSLDLIESFKPLIHLRVAGETLALRHLVIRYCRDLTTIDISAPNLVSFIYHSIRKANIKFDVRNAPKLVEFSFRVFECPPLTASVLHLLRCFSHIQKLDLQIWREEPGDMMKLIELTSVKHFTMHVLGYHSQHVLAWIPLLKAFPVLQTFTLDMDLRFEKRIDGMTRCNDKFPGQCLEVFEFLGFVGSDGDFELVKYFLQSMVPPEEIILRRYSGAVPWVAAKLKQIIPKEIKLVYLSPLVKKWGVCDLFSQA